MCGVGVFPETRPSMADNSTNGKLNLRQPDSGLYQLKKLRAHHHNILRLYALGMKQKDIAKRLGVTAQAVCYTVNSPLGKQKLKVLRGEADNEAIDLLTEFKDLAPLALAVQEQVMLDDNQKTADRLRAAESILNGAGHGKHTTIDVNHNLPTKDEIEEARMKALEGARAAGILADVSDAEIIDEDEE